MPIVASAIAVFALTGCDLPWSNTPAADPAEPRADELANAHGRPCPATLPTGEDPSGHGFGTEEAADELPTLLEPQEAWVCRYTASRVSTTDSGGTVYEWRLEGQPRPVADNDLTDLQNSLDDLTPADPSRACTADLGPRWMVSYSHDGDLTGVVIDDYGCRDVRLSDDPHVTPPGADDQDGTVGGVLGGGLAILDALGVSRTDG